MGDWNTHKCLFCPGRGREADMIAVFIGGQRLGFAHKRCAAKVEENSVVTLDQCKLKVTGSTEARPKSIPAWIV